MNKKETSILKQIEVIMDSFDFAKVQKVMSFLNWKWYNSETETCVPDEYELRRTARKLLKEVAYGEDKTIMTGGFFAEKYYDEEVENEIRLTLTFYVDFVDSGDYSY